MIIRFPSTYDTLNWLLNIEYRQGGTTQRYRWTDGDAPVNITGDGTYMPNGRAVSVTRFARGGERLKDRRWTVTIADPAGVYEAAFESNWKNRKCILYALTNPGGGVLEVREGPILKRDSLIDEEGGQQLVLEIGGLLDRVGATKKRYTNPNSQRRFAMNDDSMDKAQETADIEWGGNL